MNVVLLFSGWSGNSLKQNFDYLVKILEENGFAWEIIDYLHFESSLKKNKTMEKCIESAERNLKIVRKCYPEDTDFIAIGHSLGAIVLRALINRGNHFKEAIFVGGPHDGYLMRSYFWKFPIALLLGIKIISDLAPGSKFLKNLGPLPKGTYIGSLTDNKVSFESSIPKEAKGIRMIVFDCDHNLFPFEEKKLKKSAIPLVLERLGDYAN